VEIQELSLDGATIVTTIHVTNPNRFAVKLIESHAGVSLGSTSLLDVKLPYSITIGPRGHAEVLLPLHVSDNAVIPATDLAANEAVHMVDADLLFSTPLGDSSVRLTWQEKLALPHAPRIRLNGVEAAEHGPGQTRLRVRLAIDNPNPFPLTYGGLEGRLMDDDRTVATVQEKGTSTIAAATSTEVVVPVDVPLLSIANLLQSRTASIHVAGTMTLGGHPFPVDETAAIH
jgi:LEA14-like dessication related protein